MIWCVQIKSNFNIEKWMALKYAYAFLWKFFVYSHTNTLINKSVEPNQWETLCHHVPNHLLIASINSWSTQLMLAQALEQLLHTATRLNMGSAIVISLPHQPIPHSCLHGGLSSRQYYYANIQSISIHEIKHLNQLAIRTVIITTWTQGQRQRERHSFIKNITWWFYGDKRKCGSFYLRTDY